MSSTHTQSGGPLTPHEVWKEIIPKAVKFCQNIGHKIAEWAWKQSWTRGTQADKKGCWWKVRRKEGKLGEGGRVGSRISHSVRNTGPILRAQALLYLNSEAWGQCLPGGHEGQWRFQSTFFVFNKYNEQSTEPNPNSGKYKQFFKPSSREAWQKEASLELGAKWLPLHCRYKHSLPHSC